jgi:hypothetical protein
MPTTRPTNQPHASNQSLSDRLAAEGLRSIVDAADDLGIRITPRTALRLATAGVRGARLESIRVGGRRMTSIAAIRRFLRAQQDDDAPSAPVSDRAGVAPLSPEAARRVLQSHGLVKE